MDENKDLYSRCFNSSLRLLARKDYSEHKMRQKLLERKYPEEICEQVIEEITELNYLREDLYKEARIKGFIRKGYTTNIILYRLSQEKCSATSEEVENIYAEMGLTPYDQLREIIEKKVRIDYDFVQDKNKLKQKVLRYAQSRGHDLSSTLSLYDQILQEISQ